ncbi:MAG: alpha/beta hydrolase [Bdellovibrionaceae bacterium]|nr:alpha/beta hydrolase [Pseudobdellovibrionaceae bacterium]
MKHNTSFLFLRGLGRNQYHWGDQSAFRMAFGNQVYFLDQPGFGENINVRSPASVPAITDRLNEQWESLNVDKDSKKVLVGLSLGGMVSMDWVSRYPETWDYLILINSSVKDLSPFWQRLKMQNYISLIKISMMSDPLEREEAVFDLTCNMSDKESTLNWWDEIYQKYPPDIVDITNQLYAASKFKSPKSLPERLKTLVLTSKADRLVSYKCSVAISKKYNTDIRFHNQAGHDLVLDDLFWCVAQIKEWLNTQDDFNF